MNNETYNGWTNYATWRVNLEMIDSDYYTDWLEDNAEYYEDDIDEHIYVLKETLENDVASYLEEQGQGLTLDYALAFLDDVNWYEIAEHIYNDYKGE